MTQETTVGRLWIGVANVNLQTDITYIKQTVEIVNLKLSSESFHSGQGENGHRCALKLMS